VLSIIEETVIYRTINSLKSLKGEQMPIYPKQLNENNRGYGYKERQNAWREASLAQLSRVSEYYNNGGYDRAINDGTDIIKANIQSVGSLPYMDESQLAILYFMGKSFLRMGQINQAVGCFHIVYSQIGFESVMLNSPMDFKSLPKMAGTELEKIASEKGEDYVNNFQVDEFMTTQFKKSGCFIATAAYGSSLAPEVIVFSQFRDEVLLKSNFGTAFTKIYYFTSPPFASLISKTNSLRCVVRSFVLSPLLKLLKRHFDF
jgi:hypothetical protein